MASTNCSEAELVINYSDVELVIFLKKRDQSVFKYLYKNYAGAKIFEIKHKVNFSKGFYMRNLIIKWF